MNLIMVMLGGAIGSAFRFGFNSLVKLTPLPALNATFAVNIIGSFLIGMAFAHFVFGKEIASPWALFILTGILGGFTTFSAFSLELMTLIQNGRLGLAVIYALLSVLLALAAVILGYWVAR